MVIVTPGAFHVVWSDNRSDLVGGAPAHARALDGHGPRGVQGWDDDRTVVVVKVLDPLA